MFVRWADSAFSQSAGSAATRQQASKAYMSQLLPAEVLIAGRISFTIIQDAGADRKNRKRTEKGAGSEFHSHKRRHPMRGAHRAALRDETGRSSPCPAPGSGL